MNRQAAIWKDRNPPPTQSSSHLTSLIHLMCLPHTFRLFIVPFSRCLGNASPKANDYKWCIPLPSEGVRLHEAALLTVCMHMRGIQMVFILTGTGRGYEARSELEDKGIRSEVGGKEGHASAVA